MTVSIFVFAAGFGRLKKNKNRGSRSVSVLWLFTKNTTRGRLPGADEK